MTDLADTNPETTLASPTRLPEVFASPSCVRGELVKRKLRRAVMAAVEDMQENPDHIDAVVCEHRSLRGCLPRTVTLPSDVAQRTADDFVSFEQPIERALRLGALQLDRSVIRAIVQNS